MPLTADDRYVVAKARIGQSTFRKRLIEKYNDACCLCGLNFPQLLVASHIKPWAYCNPIEKADIHNGLLLCRNHDALFNQHLITFDTKGKIIIYETIARTDYPKLFLDENMRITLIKEMRGYMLAHRRMALGKKTLEVNRLSMSIK